MSLVKTYILALIIILTTSITVAAQGRFKAGGGVNYVSNNFEEVHLTNYFAHSVNLNYTFLKKQRLSLAIENATTFKGINKENEGFGLTSALPVIVSYDMSKTGVYIGSGPAYIKQTEKGFQYNERVSEYNLSLLAGVSFKGKPILGDLIFVEYNLRWSYLKNLRNSNYDAAMISFIIFLRA